MRQITGINDGGDLFPDNTNSSTNNTASDTTSVNNTSKRTVTEEEFETLERIKYNKVTDKIESTVPITTTLNSFYLGEQHKMSSGGENMFFTNLTSGVNFFPMWGGIKDHSDAANRTIDGVVKPSGRVYGDFFSLVLGDVTNVGAYLPYEGSNTFDANISGLGITTTLGENLPNTVKLEYRLYIGDSIVYSQPLENENGYSKDDALEWWFDHPVEIFQGTTITASITKVIKTTGLDDGVLLVYSGVDTNSGLTRYQTTVHNRVFTDKDVLLEGDIPVVDDQAASGYVDIGAMRIQWGIMNSTAFTSQGAANYGSRITYPAVFGNTPTLTGSLTDGSNQGTNLTFSGVTTTRGIVRLRDLDVNSWETNSFEVSWIAIGLK